MLKQRFLLALLPLPILFLGVELYSVYVLWDLEHSLKEIVELRLDSIIATERMQEATLVMQQAVTHASQDAGPETIASFEGAVTRFSNSLNTQLERVANTSEARLTRQLELVFNSLRSHGRSLFTTLTSLERAKLASAFTQSTSKVRTLTEQIRALNSDAIRASTAEAEHTRRSSTILLSGLMLIAILIWLLASLRLSRSILSPVRSLIQSIQAAGENQTSLAIPKTSPDELGVLVQEFNNMSARLETYRNSTTARVVRAQRILNATLAAMPDPVYVVTQELRVELRNAAAGRIYGQEDELLPALLRDRAAKVFVDGQDYLPRRFQEALVRQVDNEPRYFLPKIFIMRDELQRIMGAAIVLEDVTQFRLLDELKSNFVSTVSHEIKTPLTSIRMAVHLLQEETVGPLQPRQAALLKTAREDIERLLRLLNNLLDVAHFEHGNPQMCWEKACVCELVGEAVREVKTLCDSRQLTLRVDCPEDLPDLYIDRARISHVLRNLLTNAIKHSPARDEIRLSVTPAENGGVKFTVRDRGPGIPKNYHERIFERFFRVPGQKEHGSGLGLSIAREIILAHTGSIGCESEPDRETSFYFCLPTAMQQQQRLAPAEPHVA